MSQPTEKTSNYGWAIWHLSQAQKAGDSGSAQYHLQAAQVRALLDISCELGAQRGVDPNGPTVWRDDWDG